MGSNLHPGEHKASVNGVELRYRVAGRGPVLVFQSPGWGIGAAPYEATLAPLEQACTMVYCDPRGSGASGSPRDTDGPHVGTFVEDLEALREHLGLDAFGLAGHSHGGLIALHYALRHPRRVQRLLPVSAQLVGLPRHPGERDLATDPGENLTVAAALEYLDAVGGLDALFSLRSDDAAMAFLRRVFPLYFKDPRKGERLARALEGRSLPVRTLRAVSAADARFPLPPRGLATLDVPTLVVAGRFDVFCPPSGARQLADTVPGAELVVFEESGHFPWLEEPDRFFDVASAFLGEGA